MNSTASVPTSSLSTTVSVANISSTTTTTSIPTTSFNNVTSTLSTTTTTTTLPPTTTSTIATTTTSVASTPQMNSTSTVTSILTTIAPDGSSGTLFISMVIFIVAVALVCKIIISQRKKRSQLIGGSARWRLAASQQSGAGPARTAASYVPMGSRDRPGGLDAPGPDRSIDWERQFFDDTEPTESNGLQLNFRR